MVGKMIRTCFRRCSGRGAICRLTWISCGRALASELAAQTGHVRSAEEIADGFLQIAVANMAHAIKHISVERGYDVTEYTLCCFGGAGGQHACAVADALGMTRSSSIRWRGVVRLRDGTRRRKGAAPESDRGELSSATLGACAVDFGELARERATTEIEAQGIAAERIALKRTCI